MVEHHLLPPDEETRALYAIDEIARGALHRVVESDAAGYHVLEIDTVYFLRATDLLAFRKYTDRIAEAMHHEIFYRALAAQNDVWLHDFVEKRKGRGRAIW